MKVRAVLVSVMLLLCVGVAGAHEFVLLPEQTKVKSGSELACQVVSCHVFMESEELEPLEHVQASLLQNGHSRSLALRENAPAMVLEGSARLVEKGTAILVGHRDGLVWTETTKGWQQAPKDACTGVLSSGKYEKFCKTLVTVGRADDAWREPVGQRLEIIPGKDPARCKAGDALPVTVLFDGRPLAAEVSATYNGFSPAPNVYACTARSDADGVAYVPISHDGTWMVRAEHVLEQPTAAYDRHVLRAVLVFGVQ